MSSTQQKPLQIFNASAGSGKTYTLVQEYLRIILHSSNPKKFRAVLAMTFTNKAANEMKTRILDGLIQLAKPEYEKTASEITFLTDTSKNLGIGPKVLEERAQKILNQILHNYHAFSVMTIDKFTHRIIRTFARDLNISVDFDVELDLTGLRKNVTDLLFDEIGKNEELTELMMRYARTNLNRDRSWNFSDQIFDFSSLLFREDAIKSISLLKKLTAEDFHKIQEDLQQENAKIEAAIDRNANEAFDLIKSKGLTDSDFQGKSSGINGFLKRLIKGTYTAPSPTLVKYVSENKWGHPQSPNRFQADEIGPLLAQYFKQITDILESGVSKIALNKEILKNLNNLSLLNHLLSLVEGVKEEQNVLLISDFYKKIADIIVNEKIPFIYERMGTRYEHFLLDEFQDTSHLQWVNMIPLIHNSLATANLNLIVGDGKQAIYRWRNGEVEQFTNLPKKILNPENIASLAEAEKQFSESGELKRLKKNFRSSPEIVHFNNKLFRKLSESLAPELQYIYHELEQEPVKKFPGYVEANFKPELTTENQLDYALNCVKRAVEKGFRYKDICILVRKNDKGALLADHLTKNGIEVISPDSLFISKDHGVKLIFSMMCAAAVPSQKNFKIKTIEHYSSLILKTDPAEKTEQFRDSFSKKTIEEIFEIENYHFKKYTDFPNLYDYVFYLIETFKLDLLQNPYLQFLLEEVHLFEKRVNPGIRDFIDWFREKGMEHSIISPEGSDAVQVMTIFKAKGLEFPVVICPFFDWRFELSRQISWVENESGKLPAYFVNITSKIKDTEISGVYNEEESKYYLDQLNLLYVAFTRPEMALFISGNSKKPSTPIIYWLDKYFKSSGYNTNENGCFFTGTFVRTETTTKTISAKYLITENYPRLNRIQMSFKSGLNWNRDDSEFKRTFGNKLHQVLSKIKVTDDAENVVELQRKKGLIEDEDVPVIQDELKKLFSNPHFRSYFEEKSYCERELITSTGLKMIPDKIIFGDHETLVVDFKTGKENTTHLDQVSHYVEQLKSMDYPNVRGEIFYTLTGEVKYIN